MTWLDFSALSDPNAARDAAAKIRRADIVVFAAPAEGRIPATVTEWIEGWLANRENHEGILAGLIDGGTNISGLAAEKHSWLRSVAHRGGMDYVTEVPQEITQPIPDSLESFSERAEQVTSVLDEILHRPKPVTTVALGPAASASPPSAWQSSARPR